MPTLSEIHSLTIAELSRELGNEYCGGNLQSTKIYKNLYISMEI